VNFMPKFSVNSCLPRAVAAIKARLGGGSRQLLLLLLLLPLSQHVMMMMMMMMHGCCCRSSTRGQWGGIGPYNRSSGAPALRMIMVVLLLLSISNDAPGHWLINFTG
jgi:hypothetical protein